MFDRISPFKKAKSKTIPSVQVANLDKFSFRNYSVTLHGKDHQLHAPELREWFEIVDANNKIFELTGKKELTRGELVDAYHELISRLCKTITKEDIEQCTHQQVAALWQICLDMMQGADQKKTLANMMLQGMTKKDLRNLILVLSRYESILPESLPSSQDSTQDGPSNIS